MFNGSGVGARERLKNEFLLSPMQSQEVSAFLCSAPDVGILSSSKTVSLNWSRELEV